MASEEAGSNEMASKDNLFSVIFNDSDDEDKAERRRRAKASQSCASIKSPSRKNRRRRSKYYTRPVFKEPGSKPADAQENELDASKEKKNQTSSALVNELRGEVGRLWKIDSDPEAIAPKTRSTRRLEKLVGKAGQSSPATLTSPREERSNTKRTSSQGLDRAALYEEKQARNRGTLDQTSVPLDAVYELQKSPSELKQLRHELGRMVSNLFGPTASDSSRHAHYTTHDQAGYRAAGHRGRSNRGYTTEEHRRLSPDKPLTTMIVYRGDGRGQLHPRSVVASVPQGAAGPGTFDWRTTDPRSMERKRSDRTRYHSASLEQRFTERRDDYY